MKKRVKPLALLLCALLVLSMFPAAAGAATADRYKPIVILKLDDLNTNTVNGFQTAFEIVQEEGVKAGFGVIGSSLEDDGTKQSYYDKIKEWHDAGIEIWHHGYLHSETEYHDSDYDSQYENFNKTVQLLQDKCGITVTSFGSPHNNSDATTAQMIDEKFPQITNVMLSADYGEHNFLRLPTRANIEPSTGNVDYEHFLENYEKLKRSPYIVLQGHAGMWDENDLSEFRKVLAFLKDRDSVFMTPSEYTEYYREQEANPSPEPEYIDVMLNGSYMEFEDTEPVMMNDRVLVPFRAIFEALDADITWDADTATATAVKGDNTVVITENDTTAYLNGEAVELDVAATIVGDRFVVPIRFVSESLDQVVYWDEPNNTVIIVSKTEKPYTLPEGAVEIKDCTFSSFFEDELGYFSYDGDVDTLWSCEGNPQWICYDLGESTTISKVSIVWNKGDQRQAIFRLETSEDGVNFTTVYDGKASGTTTDYEDYTLENAKGRYFRVYCMGNSSSAWNAVKEIIIYK